MSNQPVTPIIDPDRGWRTWHIDEIFTGQGPGRYVPNEDDYVWSWDQGAFRVTDVDYTTGLSVLTQWSAPKEMQTIDQTDVLLGSGPGYQSESYRVYVDKSVTPHTMAVDARLRIYETEATSIKIFKGNDISPNGKVISRRYDQNGTYLGENIPLKAVVSPVPGEVGLDPEATFVENVKVPEVGYTLEDVQDGDLVVAVAYSAEGNAISISKLLVKNTAFIRSAGANKRYVTGIRIESPFLSGADPRVLEYPINMPVNALAMMGVVSFSDGGQQRIPIDGSKFSLHGLDTFIPTILGQKIPLVLTYKLSADESAYDAQSGEHTHVSEAYYAKTVEVVGAYTVKLFAYPTWIDANNGYRLEYFLYNLDREQVYYATPYVRLAANSPAYNPKLYGTTQNLTLATVLNEVNGRFSGYTHVQTIGITLRNPGNIDASNWEVQYTPNQPPVFGGEGMAARFEFLNVEHYKLHLDLECGSKEEWLDKIYYPTQPLYNPRAEHEPPAPTHFKLVLGNRVIEYSVDQWDEVLEVPNDLKEGQTVYLEFFKRTPQTDLQLAIAGLPMHQINYG